MHTHKHAHMYEDVVVVVVVVVWCLPLMKTEVRNYSRGVCAALDLICVMAGYVRRFLLPVDSIIDSFLLIHTSSHTHMHAYAQARSHV